MAWSNRRSFNLATINHSALDIPGVYVFWRGHLCIYVGVSKNLRKRLLKHFEDSHNEYLKFWIASSYQLSLNF